MAKQTKHIIEPRRFTAALGGKNLHCQIADK